MVSRMRIATLEGKTREYEPSRTELYLENICKSFGTELLQAEINPINGTKLVRLSQPAIVHHTNGKRRILQTQYTRFSPLHYSEAVEVYNENRARRKGKRKISSVSVHEEIARQHEEWDVFEEVTNPDYIAHLNLHRWEKELYFAVYDTEDKRLEEGLRPFLIHEPVHINGKLPQVHITFHIEPYFVIGQIGLIMRHREDISDSIKIDYSQIKAEHRERIGSALFLHPLNNLRNPENVFKEEYVRFGETYQVHPRVPRELTMGLIAAYLRKLCLDKDFY